MLGNAGEVRRGLCETFSKGLPHMDKPVQTLIHQLCADIWSHLEDLPLIVYGDEYIKRKSKECLLLVNCDDDDDDDVHDTDDDDTKI